MKEDPVESISSLRAELAQAPDDRTRAELLDALATQLAVAGRFEEGLAESVRAVALLERLAQSDPDRELQLAIILGNHGSHLNVARRYDDALVPIARAIELRLRRGLAEPGTLPAIARHANDVGALLGEMQAPALAAGFDYFAFAAELKLAEEDPDHLGPARASVRPLSSRRVARFLSEGVAAALEAERANPSVTPGTREVIARVAPLVAEAGIRRQPFGLDPPATLERLFRLLGGAEIVAIERVAAWLSGRGVTPEQRSRSDPNDYRLWSCTGQQLSVLIGEIGDTRFPPSDTHGLGARLREAGLYLARDFQYCCMPRPPQVFITHVWSDRFVDLQVAIRSALDYLGYLVRAARPDLDPTVVEMLVNTKLGVWVDFIFIDQSARDLAEEVREVLPHLLDAADVHFVLSDTAMLRSWCCYELALFNKRAPTERLDQRSLRSFVGRSQSLKYQTFAQTSTTNPEDKGVIEHAVRDLYPGGMPALDSLLIQASMLSDPFVARGFAQSTAAEELVKLHIDTWLSL